MRKKKLTPLSCITCHVEKEAYSIVMRHVSCGKRILCPVYQSRLSSTIWNISSVISCYFIKKILHSLDFDSMFRPFILGYLKKYIETMDLFVSSFENCSREQFFKNTKNTILVLCFLFFSFFFVFL